MRCTSLDRPATTVGTTLSHLQSTIMPFWQRFSVCPFVTSLKIQCSSLSFPRDSTAGVSSRSWTVTNMFKSLTWTHFWFDECSFVPQVTSREFCSIAWPISKLLFLHHLLPKACCLFGSLFSNVGASGVRCFFVFTVDNFQRWSQWFPNCD